MNTEAIRMRALARLRLLALRAGPLYLRARRLEGVARKIAKRPHESDFSFFSRFAADDGLFLDIGANAGMAAVSFRIFQPRCRMLCIEPNPAHEPDLRFLRSVLGRMDYLICGAGEENTRLTLYVPSYRSVPITPLATLDRSQIEADWRLEILFGRGFDPRHYAIAEHQVDVRRLDDLDLAPTFVKMDVEGYELPVLRGLERTLRTHRPILLLEWSREFPAIEEFLQGCGYQPHIYDRRADALRPYAREHKGLNIFCLPASVPAEAVAA